MYSWHLAGLLTPCIPAKDEEGRPKAPPNDPQRQGNIWQRYEQLERSAKSLAGANQQMALERAKHQRVGRPAARLGFLCAAAQSALSSPCSQPCVAQSQADSMQCKEACLDVTMKHSVDVLMRTMQDKKQLEEALLELQRMNVSLLSSASGHGASLNGAASPVQSTPAESAETLCELGNRQHSHLPVSSPPQPTSAQLNKEVVCITPHTQS